MRVRVLSVSVFSVVLRACVSVQAKAKPPIYSLLSVGLCWTVGDLCCVGFSTGKLVCHLTWRFSIRFCRDSDSNFSPRVTSSVTKSVFIYFFHSVSFYILNRLN